MRAWAPCWRSARVYEGFKVGDRVSVVPNTSLGDIGMYAEEAIVPVRSLLHAPPGVSDVEAASIWMQYFTAMAIIEDRARPRVGDYVIVRAASSSVGLAAIQLANWAGAVPIAATRRSDKAAGAESAGRSMSSRRRKRTSSRKSCASR